MVVRLGIGASAATAIVFSVLLFSSFLVFTSSQNRYHLYSIADEDDSLGDSAVTLMGAGGANILVGAQEALAAHSLDCQAARMEAASAIDSLSDYQGAGGVTVRSTAGLAPDSPAGDNLSMLAPFDGSVPGGLDILVSMSVTGTSPSGGASIDRTEVHLLHLPVELQRLSADCLGALDAAVAALSTETPANCTEGGADPLLQEAFQKGAALAATDGFEFGFSYALIPGAECGVSLQILVQQRSIDGPGGPFTVQLEVEGLASFGQSASAQQGGTPQRTGP